MQSLSHFRYPSSSNQKNFSFRISLRRRKRGSHTKKTGNGADLFFFTWAFWVIASFSRKEKFGLNSLCVFENTFFSESHGKFSTLRSLPSLPSRRFKSKRVPSRSADHWFCSCFVLRWEARPHWRPENRPRPLLVTIQQGLRLLLHQF